MILDRKQMSRLTSSFLVAALLASCGKGGSSPAVSPAAAPTVNQPENPSAKPSAGLFSNPAGDKEDLIATGCTFAGTAKMVLSCSARAKREDLDKLADQVIEFISDSDGDSDMTREHAAAQVYLIQLQKQRAADDKKAPGELAEIKAEQARLRQAGCVFAAGAFSCPAEKSPMKALNRNVSAGRLQAALEDLPKISALGDDDAELDAAQAAALDKALPAMRKAYETIYTANSEKVAVLQKTLGQLADSLGTTLGFEIVPLGDCFSPSLDDSVRLCTQSVDTLTAFSTQLKQPAALETLKDRHIDLLTLRIVSTGALKWTSRYSIDHPTEDLDVTVSTSAQIAQVIAAAPKHGQGDDAVWTVNAKDFLETQKAIAAFLAPVPVDIDSSEGTATFSAQGPALKSFLTALQRVGAFKPVPMTKLWLGIVSSGSEAFFEIAHLGRADAEIEFSSQTSQADLVTAIRKMVGESLVKPTPTPAATPKPSSAPSAKPKATPKTTAKPTPKPANR